MHPLFNTRLSVALLSGCVLMATLPSAALASCPAGTRDEPNGICSGVTLTALFTPIDVQTIALLNSFTQPLVPVTLASYVEPNRSLLIEPAQVYNLGATVAVNVPTVTILGSEFQTVSSISRDPNLPPIVEPNYLEVSNGSTFLTNLSSGVLEIHGLNNFNGATTLSGNSVSSGSTFFTDLYSGTLEVHLWNAFNGATTFSSISGPLVPEPTTALLALLAMPFLMHRRRTPACNK